MKSIENRHFGMDVLRTIAVLTVLIGHGLIFFPQFFQVQWLLFLAVFGVELFFSLSGFLIGNILIKMCNERIDFKDVVSFWLKRWLRTIPVYLVIVIITMVVLQKFYWSYLVFLQNYIPEHLNDFQISWSLTIEEWFYVTFPLLMYGINKTVKLGNMPRNYVPIISIVFFLMVPLLLRFFAINEQGNWDMTIRKQIHLRLDAIAYGVFLAYLYHHHKQWFTKKRYSLLGGVLLMVGFITLWWASNAFINIFIAQPNVFNNLVFYPLINIFTTLMVAYFIRYQRYKNTVMSKLILFVSLTSYSLYLVHFPIYEWFAQSVTSPITAFLFLSVALCCVFACGALLYKLVELPFINLRDRIVKGSYYSAV